jgi:hypothetical protein
MVKTKPTRWNSVLERLCDRQKGTAELKDLINDYLVNLIVDS